MVYRIASVSSDADIARLLGLPPWLKVTARLRARIRALQGARAEWLADGRRLLAFLIATGRLGISNDANGDDILAFLNSRPELSSGRQLNILGRARVLLKALDRAPAPTIALKTYRSILVRTRADNRVRAAAISDDPDATAVTIDDLFPTVPTALGDAVDHLAALLLGSIAGRPQEGVQIPMRLIKREEDGYYVDAAWSKTDARTFRLDNEVVDAINLVAKLDATGIRHILGVSPDRLLPHCDYSIIPRLDSRRDRILPGTFTEFWFGRMMKRRVRALCEDRGLPTRSIDLITKRVTGKAMRRGRNAKEAHQGTSSQDQSDIANLRSRNLLVTYSDGIYSSSAIREFVLGFLPAALASRVQEC